MKKILLLVLFVSFSFLLNAQDAYLKKGYTVAFSKSYFDEMITATSKNDITYFKKLINEKKIVTLTKDIKVTVVETSLLKGTIVAKLYGKDSKIWTVYEALKYE